MGSPSPRRSLALPALLLAGLLAFAAARSRTPEPEPSASAVEDVPAPRPEVIRAFRGPVETLNADVLEGLNDRQRAAARKAVDEARRRLDGRSGGSVR